MAQTERGSLSKRVRFEVFKRDSFTCQYCGRSAPDVVLEVDHIQPVSKEGTDDILNLITSCRDCNAGKSDKELSDDAAIQKKRRQLEELQERREQIEMMMEWQQGLAVLDDDAVMGLAEMWKQLVTGYHLNEHGISTLRKWIKRFGLTECAEAMRASVTGYLEWEGEQPKKESVEKTFDYIARICAARQRAKDRPYMQDLYYARGIMRKRMYVSERWAMELMEKAYSLGIDTEELKELARSARNWTDWRDTITDWIKSISEAK